MPRSDMNLHARWESWWKAAGARGASAVHGAALLAAWSEPHRHYHTPAHLAACLEDLDRWRSLAEDPLEMELALWFHDAVYDPRARDNEGASADWARRFCVEAGLTYGDRVASLIETTRHTQAPGPGDGALLVDIDLAILAAAPPAYDAYAASVRREYNFVDDAAFRSGRASILRGFLARPTIYLTPSIHDQRERRARGNLRRELQGLEA